MISFAFPNLDDAGARFVVKRLRELVGEHGVVGLFFNKVKFARPFATLAVASALRTFLEERELADLPTILESDFQIGHTQPEGANYLDQMGFFRLAGLRRGRAPGELRGGKTYVPIKSLRWDKYPQGAKPFYDAIEADAAALSAIATPSPGGGRDAVDYSLFETIRNVYEHAKTGGCIVFAQAYQKVSQAEIAVVDRGIGIRAALEHRYPGVSSEDALRKAIEPGVTANEEEENDWDPYQNTGFGLYVMSELARQCKGEFTVWSDGAALDISEGKTALVSAVPFAGTAVKVRVNLDAVADFRGLRATIVGKGEETAGKRKGPSKSKGITVPVALSAMANLFQFDLEARRRAQKYSEPESCGSSRPREHHIEVLRAAAEELSESLERLTGMPREVIVPALVRAIHNEDGENSVESLLMQEGWTIDLPISEQLDMIAVTLAFAERREVQAWVQRYAIVPELAVGDRIGGNPIVRIAHKSAQYVIVDTEGREHFVEYGNV